MGGKKNKQGGRRLTEILCQIQHLDIEIKEAAGARDAVRIRHLQRRRDVLQEELDRIRYELQEQGRAYLVDADEKLGRARECRSGSGSLKEAMIAARESIEYSAKAITLFTGGRPPPRHHYTREQINATLQALPEIPARQHNFLRIFVLMNLLSWLNTLATYAPEYHYAHKYMRDLFRKQEVDLALEWAEESFAAALGLITWIDEQSMKL